MRRLILRCGFALGDLVMLTAAVRDLHRCYPGQFLTDVRTAYLDLWEHNPHITPLPDSGPQVEIMDCSYPLINRCNRTPYHCLHGFIEFLNERLGLAIKPTAFKGDIHLSEQEKRWYSQVHELTGQDTPFWIIAAGGKYDVTIKWWQSERYQEVVNHFGGRIQFVQVGDYGHHHPKLEGAMDLRGQTNLRQLIRLVYHSQGVLCSVTGLMHLAAAVETRKGRSATRACVVVAGGREPAHWEAYPDHQFIHTNGALACCVNGGCWRDRTVPLRDGDPRDHRKHLCMDVQKDLAHCMALITPGEVARRIETYYDGGVLKYLTLEQRLAAERGILARAKNPYDQQRLNLHSAGRACEQFIRTLATARRKFYQGRGIVICGGGVRYFTGAWVGINMLRSLGCQLPIQLWHLGEKEIDKGMQRLLAPLGVECIDACEMRKQCPVRILRGWELKPYAILHSPFRQVLLLDADNVPVINPEFLFDTPQFHATGAIFWPDYPSGEPKRALPAWRSCGLRQPAEPEFETGQIIVDKERCWPALRLTLWFNENSDFYYQYIHGDKETFHLAFHKLKQPYSLVPKPIHTLAGTMCQHDFEGRRIFQHRNTDKWDLFLYNDQVDGFWFEAQCRAYIKELQQSWEGGPNLHTKERSPTPARPKKKALKLEAIMITSVERDEVRRQTLENLAKTDWANTPLHIQVDESGGDNPHKRHTFCTFLALKKALERAADYILLLEDDLDFNRHLGHNLLTWHPVRSGTATLASLYNPRLPEVACDLKNRARIISPDWIFGSQAFILSKATAEYIVRNWHRVQGRQDIKISRLAGRLKAPVFYHAPSLVQHIGSQNAKSVHRAKDFDPDWRA